MNIESVYVMKNAIDVVVHNLHELKYLPDYDNKVVVSDLIEESETYIRLIKRYLVDNHLVE